MTPHTNPQPPATVASNTDLLAVAGYVVLVTVVVAVAPGLPTAVALPLVLPALLVAPGYVVVTAIVPETDHARGLDQSGDRTGRREATGGLSPLERLTLAVVTSVAVVPLVALGLDHVVGVELLATLVGVAAVTVVAAVVAAHRRRPSTAEPSPGVATGSRRPRSVRDGIPTDAITLACGAIAVLMVVTGATMAMSGAPPRNAEFYLVTETADGDYEATGYPSTLERGEPTEFTLGIEQQGRDAREYTVVPRLVARAGSAGGATAGAVTLERFSTTVEPDEVTYETHAVTPTTAGGELTLSFLLYRGDAPADPSRETAHRVVGLPVAVR